MRNGAFHGPCLFSLVRPKPRLPPDSEQNLFYVSFFVGSFSTEIRMAWYQQTKTAQCCSTPSFPSQQTQHHPGLPVEDPEPRSGCSETRPAAVGSFKGRHPSQDPHLWNIKIKGQIMQFSDMCFFLRDTGTLQFTFPMQEQRLLFG